jgi:hypothetical protein
MSDVVVLVDDPSTEENEEEHTPAPGRQQSKPKRHSTQGRKDSQEWMGLLFPPGDQIIRKESKDRKLTLDTGWKFKKYFLTQSEARLWLTVGTDPSDSDPSSSSSSNSEEDNSSSSSSGGHCQHHRSKQSTKNRKNHKKRASYHGTDPSTGDDKNIHEFEIADTKIDKALAPNNLTNKEHQGTGFHCGGRGGCHSIMTYVLFQFGHDVQ